MNDKLYYQKAGAYFSSFGNKACGLYMHYQQLVFCCALKEYFIDLKTSVSTVYTPLSTCRQEICNSIVCYGIQLLLIQT